MVLPKNQIQITFDGDSDNDSVQDCLDCCPGGDDTVNSDGMGMPDACDCDANNAGDEMVDIPGMIITKTDLDPGLYQAAYQINSTAHSNPNKIIVFKAGKTIILEPGFHAQAETDFTAQIELCNSPNNPLVADKTSRFLNVLAIALEKQAQKRKGGCC